MTEEKTGVKIEDSEGSPLLDEKDVKVDVETSSTEGAEKGGNETPETVPYEALQAKVSKIAELEAKIENLTQEEAPALDNGTEKDWFADEGNGNDTTQQNQAPVQQPDIEEIEAELAEQMISTPLKALTPFIKQMMIAYDKEKQTARSLPGYDNFQDEISKVPDNIVYQALSNPELVRALLAKERYSGKKERAMAAQQAKEAGKLQNSSQDENASLLELKNKYIEEGKQAVLAEMKKKSGQIAEGSAAASSSASGNVANVLDEKGKALMAKMGITSDDALTEVVNNLDAYLKGN